MPDRLLRRISRYAAALAACLTLATPAAPAPDLDGAELRRLLMDLSKAISTDPEIRALAPFDLLSLHHLGGPLAADRMEPPGREARISTPARAEIIDFRPVLTLMSQGLGEEDNRDVLLSQGSRGAKAVSFRGGTVTLSHLQAELERLMPDLAGEAGLLRTPVVLWEDADLLLGGGEHLTFSRADGAFLISLGRVEITGAHLDATVAPNPFSDEFAPFLAVVGGGSLMLRDATVRGLGFGYTDKFAGVSVLRHPLMSETGRTSVIGSLFEDLVSLVVTGAGRAAVTGNRFYDMRGNAVRLRLSPSARVDNNVFGGRSPANAIRILDNSGGTDVIGNLILPGKYVGIVVEAGSSRVRIARNIVWRRSGGGLKFTDSACGLITDNILLDNRQKGIEVYASPGIRVIGNLIEGNSNAALWMSGQPAHSLSWIEDNRIAQNGMGLFTASSARIWMNANDLTRQLPRLLGGDIAMQNRAIASDLHGRTPLLVSPGIAELHADREPSPCWPEGAG